ncbi:ABC transporter permease [Ornithinimicrobium cryptoxanthini]|uniref:ABC transporter permease n=1 Tax=Ornithinimicrobium cryptoxanthini TaxID=2934161 RepID=A0ABY4YE10_9MICO|nr:ABC transporter permease [Ornithinimicrobium cryptoxanthini]USQ74963.1 ABC transporter permease [Ornithinimicrobium cryptoxanthini]
MLRFILRRLGVSAFILVLGSVFLFFITVFSGDPLEDLRESRDRTAPQQMEARIRNMNLEEPWYVRYWMWAVGVAKCVTLNCDLGVDSTGRDIQSALTSAASSTLRLVTLATVLAIIIGISMGILAAIRQYSGFDYAVTFASFLFFSLPVFWVAVLLKEYGAIRFNDWIADPGISLTATIIIGLLFGVTLASLLGGDLRRKLITGAASAVFAIGAMLYFDSVGWWRQPALGLGLIILIAVGAAVVLTYLTVGRTNPKILYAALTTIAVGVVGFFVFQSWIKEPTYPLLLLMLAIGVAVAIVSGWLWGGWDKGIAIWVSIGTAVAFAGATALDQLLRNWGPFLERKPRPISTIGSGAPNFEGPFWTGVWDWGVQLILPTVVLTVISLAAYSRYTRASMLETIRQDYVRTARSKGLSERVVITKHALRNALIPITTIVAFDFAGLIGGAVVTESVFGWSGMGAMFESGLDRVDPGPVMAFYLVTGTAAVLMNMIADIAYAFLDPRIRT